MYGGTIVVNLDGRETSYNRYSSVAGYDPRCNQVIFQQSGLDDVPHMLTVTHTGGDGVSYDQFFEWQYLQYVQSRFLALRLYQLLSPTGMITAQRKSPQQGLLPVASSAGSELCFLPSLLGGSASRRTRLHGSRWIWGLGDPAKCSNTKCSRSLWRFRLGLAQRQITKAHHRMARNRQPRRTLPLHQTVPDRWDKPPGCLPQSFAAHQRPKAATLLRPRTTTSTHTLSPQCMPRPQFRLPLLGPRAQADLRPIEERSRRPTVTQRHLPQAALRYSTRKSRALSLR